MTELALQFKYDGTATINLNDEAQTDIEFDFKTNSLDAWFAEAKLTYPNASSIMIVLSTP